MIDCEMVLSRKIRLELIVIAGQRRMVGMQFENLRFLSFFIRIIFTINYSTKKNQYARINKYTKNYTANDRHRQ